MRRLCSEDNCYLNLKILRTDAAVVIDCCKPTLTFRIKFFNE